MLLNSRQIMNYIPKGGRFIGCLKLVEGSICSIRGQNAPIGPKSAVVVVVGGGGGD
jgi:hypothetical protein